MERENRLTNKRLSDLLPKVLREIGALHRDRPDLVVAAWADLVGPLIAPMTEAVRFEGGILTVKVRNSTLYSLLCQHERGKLLKCLHQKFPTAGIKNIYFQIS